MNEKALYYPYIHIRDVNWLKATLLLFSQVRRMLPADFAPDDSEEVREFAAWSPDRLRLLCGADLWTERAVAAQEALARRLSTDAGDSSFLSKYNRKATRSLLKATDPGFQIHQMKMVQPLQDALRSTTLAWKPSSPEPYDDYEEYVEVNSRVGEAIMSTLAIASATGEGLDIVGDNRSGALHNCLLEKKADEIYDAWLHPSASTSSPQPATGEEVFEFLVGLPCNLSEVTPETLRTLQQDREPLRKLIAQLRIMSSNIPVMDPGRERETYFRDAASKVLRDWRSDRSNMANYWRKFFGEGLADQSEKFVEKVAEKLISGGEKAATGSAAGASAAAVGGAGVAGIATAAIAGAGAGLAIGVMFHGVKSYFRMRGAELNSPYRYLTLMEQAGVVFRSELGAAPQAAARQPTSFWGRVKKLFKQ